MPDEPVIAIIEDEDDLRKGLSLLLKQHRFQTVEFSNASEAWEYVRTGKENLPDLWVVDIMLPGLWDGLDFVREFRQLPGGKNTPVLVLTARGKEHDIVRGLELGADDYMVKPYRAKELIARIRALLRRYQPSIPQKPRYQWGPLSWDPERHVLKIGRDIVDLTARETEILALLIENPERFFTREEIYDRIWGFDAEAGLRTVDVHIRHIRMKLGPYSGWLLSKRGLGYTWRPHRSDTSSGD